MNLYRESYLHIRNFPPAFWVVICSTLMNQIGNMAFVFLLVYMSQYMGFSLTRASMAFVAFSASTLISGLFGGSLIDKLGAANIMNGTLFVNSLVLIVFPHLHGYYYIILMCMLWGAAFGLYRPASSTFISQLSTPGMHKISFSVFRLAINLGMSIGPMAGGYLATYSFPWVFTVNGITNLLAGIILFLGLSRAARQPIPSALPHNLLLGFSSLKYDSALRLFLIGLVPVSMIFFQSESTLPVYLSKNLHFPLSFYGWLFTINTLIIVFCELPLNVATLNWPYRVNFILGSLFITMGFAGLLFASQPWHVIMLTITWTIGEMILFPASNSYVADIAPHDRRGSYMGLFSSSTNLGILLGPWSGALVMQQYGANGLWIACGFWGIISVVIFYFLRR